MNLTKSTVALFAFLTLLSFALSYDALHQIAQLNGKSDWRSYAWPLLIDGALVIFSLYIVYSAKHQLSNTRRYWILVGVFTGLTIVFNVLSGVQSRWLHFTVAAVPPIVLFCSFETLMSMLKASVQKSPKNHQITTKKPPEVRTSTPKKTTKSARKKADYRTLVFAELESAQEELSTRKIAELVGCSPSAARKYKNEYQEAHSANGHKTAVSNGV